MMPSMDAVGLVVSDLNRALELYRHLGLDFPDVGDEEVHAEAATSTGVRVILDTEEAMKAFSDWQPPTGGSPRTALKFRCGDAAEVDRFFGELVEAGWSPHVSPFDAHWDERYATLHDADGNAVDLFAPL